MRLAVVHTCVGYASSMRSKGAALSYKDHEYMLDRCPKSGTYTEGEPEANCQDRSERDDDVDTQDQLKTRAAINIFTVVEAACIAIPARIIQEPMKRVARRPRMSDEYGVNGKPCSRLG